MAGEAESISLDLRGRQVSPQIGERLADFEIIAVLQVL